MASPIEIPRIEVVGPKLFNGSPYAVARPAGVVAFRPGRDTMIVTHNFRLDSESICNIHSNDALNAYRQSKDELLQEIVFDLAFQGLSPLHTTPGYPEVEEAVRDIEVQRPVDPEGLAEGEAYIVSTTIPRSRTSGKYLIFCYAGYAEVSRGNRNAPRKTLLHDPSQFGQQIHFSSERGYAPSHPPANPYSDRSVSTPEELHTVSIPYSVPGAAVLYRRVTPELAREIGSFISPTAEDFMRALEVKPYWPRPMR